MVFEVDIPTESWEAVKSILRDYDGDPDYLYIHKIDDGKAANVLGVIHANWSRGLDYYIECSLE